MHAAIVFIVVIIIAVIACWMAQNNSAYYIGIPAAIIAAFATYQYDLVTRAFLAVAAPGTGMAAYQIATTVEDAINPPSQFNTL